jgi:hypothetical protein
MRSQTKHTGRFRFEVYNPDGSFVRAFDCDNSMTLVGLNALLDKLWDGGSLGSTLYLGLIDNAGYTALSTGDTMSSHSGWAEATSYAEAARQEWLNGSASGQAMSNTSSPAVFTVSTAFTGRGVFVADNSTKGGSSGVLWCTALFSETQAFTPGQQVRVTYTQTAAGA